ARASETDSWQLFLKLEDAMEKQQLYLNKNITRADILEVLGIGKNRLAQMFQDMGGDLSLPTYINGKRLNHALEVISEHPEYTVNEIAEASGFSNTRNFHLLFKKRFGITPLQYRNGK
ncbi:MAG: helix-turn-helix transcriptional regulator, partial [Bacteroidales bacterium]|nr:helix-turn-helix transcriptional regulator [Bacteroidales bacterium]